MLRVIETDYNDEPIFAGQSYWEIDGDCCQIGDENHFCMWLIDAYGGPENFIAHGIKYLGMRDILSDWISGDGPEDATAFLKHFMHANYITDNKEINNDK